MISFESFQQEIKTVYQDLQSRGNQVNINLHIFGFESGSWKSVRGIYQPLHGVVNVFQYMRPLRMKAFWKALSGEEIRLRNEIRRACHNPDYWSLIELVIVQIFCYFLTLNFAHYKTKKDTLRINWGVQGKYPQQRSLGFALDLNDVLKKKLQKADLPLTVELLQWQNTKDPPKIIKR